MEPPKPIAVSSLRTGKEKFYLALFCLISFLVWFYFGLSIVRQLTAVFETKEVSQACYIRDVVSDTITSVDPNLLLPTERCLTFTELSEDEQKKITKEQGDALAKFTSNLTTPIMFVVIFLFTLFAHYVSVAFIRINGVKVGEKQYPLLWNAIQKGSLRLGIRTPPDTFVMLGHGVLNAFATRLVFRKFIIIYSELADALIEEGDERQLAAVFSHELGLHALSHTNLFLDLFLLPVNYAPLLSFPLSRAREYSSDRVMATLVPDRGSCERALIKLAVGKRFGNKANIDLYLKQASEEQGFFTWLAEKISTHPHLPNRIRAVRKSLGIVGKTQLDKDY